MKQKVILFSFCFFLIAPLALMASSAETPVIDLALVSQIVATGVGGVTISMIVQVLKGWLSLKGKGARILSIVVSYAITAGFFLINGTFAWPAFLLYGTLVAAVANGYYKLPTKK